MSYQCDGDGCLGCSDCKETRCGDAFRRGYDFANDRSITEAAVREAMRYLANGGIGIRGVFNLLRNSLPESRSGDVMEVIERVANGNHLAAEDDVRGDERERLARLIKNGAVDGYIVNEDPDGLAAWVLRGAKPRK